MGWKFYNATGHLLTAPSSTASADLATEATNVTVTQNDSESANLYPVFVDGLSSTQGIETDAGFTYNPSSGLLVIAGELDAGSLDVSGNADIDGTLEADAITIDTVTLAEYISDTVGAMVASNTETNIAVTYEDSDNTLDFVVASDLNTTGTAATVTGGTQASITSAANLVTVGTIGTGVWQGTVIAEAYLPNAADDAQGVAELAVTSEINTGTDSTRIMPIDQYVASNRNVRYIFYRLLAADTDVATATTVGGDFEFPFAGTITEVGTFNDTAGITGTQVVDIHKGGTTIMSTHKCDTDTTEKTTRSGAQLPVLTTTAIAEGDILTFDIDAIHSGTAAKGLTARLEVRVT